MEVEEKNKLQAWKDEARYQIYEYMKARFASCSNSSISDSIYFSDSNDDEFKLRVSSHNPVHECSDCGVLLGVGDDASDSDFIIPNFATSEAIVDKSKAAYIAYWTRVSEDKIKDRQECFEAGMIDEDELNEDLNSERKFLKKMMDKA